MSTRQPRGLLDRLRRWVTLTGDRQVVTLGLLLVGYLLTAPIGHWLLPHGPHFGDQQATVPLLNTMLSGTFLIFSIVVSINSLYISGEQSPLDQQFGRIQSVVEYRRQLEDVVDEGHVPASPGALIRTLSGEILERAQRLEDEIAGADADVRANISAYVEDLADETGRMNAELDDDASPLAATIAMMNYDHDRQINDLRRLRAEHDEALSPAAEQAIDELLRLLQYFAAARQYFKTLYTKSEFANLSRWLVLTSVPAVAITATFLHYLAWMPDSHLLVAGIEAVSFAPFLLVASYILRVTTIARQTWAAGQFLATEASSGAIEGIDRE